MTIDLLIFLLYSPPIFILHPIYIKFNFEMKNHTPFFQLLLIKIKQNFAFPFNHPLYITRSLNLVFKQIY